MSNPFGNTRKPLAVSSIAELGVKMIYRLPGCSDEEVRRALQSSYYDFCRLSCVYTNTQEIELEPGESEYPVVAYTPECFVDSVIEVRINRRVLKAGRDYELRTGGVVILKLAGRFVPDRPTPEQIASRPELSRKADPEIIYVKAIELPKLNSERAPRWFFDKYGEAVVAGAFVKLFGMTNKPWTDGAQAQHELLRWENFLTETRLRNIADDHSTSGSGALNALDTSGLL